jgi:hypothetical protein
VGRLNAPEHWEREVGRIYRAMRRGELDSSEAARQAYVAECGLRATRAKLEQRRLDEQAAQIAALTAQLEALRAGRPASALAALPAPTTTSTSPPAPRAPRPWQLEAERIAAERAAGTGQPGA